MNQQYQGTVKFVECPSQHFSSTTQGRTIQNQDIVRLENHKPEAIWYVKYNPQNTFKERVLRRLMVYEIATHLNIPVSNELEHIMALNVMIKQGYEKINDFYEKCRRDSSQLQTSDGLVNSRTKINNKTILDTIR